MEGSGQLHASAALSLEGRALGIHGIGGWVGPGAGQDDMKKRKFLALSGLEIRPLSRPARSQSLYRLRYRDSLYTRTYTHAHTYICVHVCIYIYTQNYFIVYF
jgi:hypothetical protein